MSCKACENQKAHSKQVAKDEICGGYSEDSQNVGETVLLCASRDTETADYARSQPNFLRPTSLPVDGSTSKLRAYRSCDH